jgi:tetraacyldisaccharide 4'-kinase
VRVGVAEGGDEPLLLARALPGVPVLVCPDRFRAGRHAEAHFEPTVHLLDDGFQHVMLARDIDLLLVDERDLEDAVIPKGWLREPLANAAVADALIVPGTSLDSARKIAERLGVTQAFTLRRRLGDPRLLHGGAVHLAPDAPLFAVAGIARPERFFDDLSRTGLHVVGAQSFRDHHVFRQRDVTELIGRARAAGASVIVTTEKDGVRLERLDVSAMPVLTVPLSATVEPVDTFKSWITSRLAAARAARPQAS